MVRCRTLLLAVALVTLAACASLPAAQPGAPEAPRGPAPKAATRERSEALRPCTRPDLIGEWEVVRMGAARAVTVDRSDPEYYAYQRFVFSSNATMRYLAAQKTITVADRQALTATPASMTWAVDAAGRLLTHTEGTPRREVSTCEVLLREVQSERAGVTGLPGDVLLTRLDAEGRAVARRQLRKLPRAAE
ncbi:MAG: hypothetical protein A3F92_08005 [Candidatus Rokubacteria bacterium RIFCSPLOWO2_12_FULL_71_22]|nr:MAG: hypothetical protein A3I17_03970 [Candidatus Rokubacteria bacterium RIFCSPLOWO2_02_FULL_72_37]OGL20170.1 MAG: hypothetical protein A3F92_08005 [Candidatus Rokubacteria bacterium RIFCSPLOWO2_12_FULL_71_22]